MSPLFPWLKKISVATRPRRRIDPSTLPSTEFAFGLFEALKPGGKNLTICPYSARVLLSMLWEGATGETRREMAETLRLDEDPDGLANHYERLGRPLHFELETARRELEMFSANSLWCDEGFTPKEEYAKTLKDHYLAEIETLSFCASDSTGKVNHWAQEKTRGRIPAIVGSLEGLSPLVAVNAVYFKGLWEEPFKAELTKDEEFTLQDGKQERVPMMRRSGEFRYCEREGTQIVGLPYKGEMSMYVLLPPKGVAFHEFCAGLSSTIGTRWTVAMGKREGHVRLPRFRMETHADLSTVLATMGMAQVFDSGRAALERISDRKPLYLVGVLQKDYVEVNEKGTEAAAVTYFELGCAETQTPPPPFEMIVNRPFVFAICDAYTGAVVFLGAVADPLENGFSAAG